MVICAACWSLELWQRELAVYVSVIIQSTGQNIGPPRANVYPVLPFSSIKKKKNPCNFSGIWDVWYIRKWNLINSGVSSMLPLCRSQIQLFSGWSHESLVSVRTENAENSHVHFQSSLDLMLLFLSVPCFVMSFLFLLWPFHVNSNCWYLFQSCNFIFDSQTPPFRWNEYMMKYYILNSTFARERVWFSIL
jgi:hypothetical protein